MNKKYRAIITFPQNVEFEHYDFGRGICSYTLSSTVILVSDNYKKIKNRSLEIAEKYNAAYVDIFNMDIFPEPKSIFFAVDTTHLGNDEFDEKLAWDIFSQFPKVVIKKGKLGYSEHGVLNIDD